MTSRIQPLAIAAILAGSVGARAEPTQTTQSLGVDEKSFVAVNLLVGAPLTGLRLEFFPYVAGPFKLSIEGAGGMVVLSPGAELGLRVQLRAISSRHDALYLAPGADIVMQVGNGNSCHNFLSMQPCSNVTYAVANLDVSWVHQIDENGASLELGLKGGYGLMVSGDHNSTVTPWVPEAAFFVGIRR